MLDAASNWTYIACNNSLLDWNRVVIAIMEITANNHIA